MNAELCIRMCREVFATKPWFLLEHGTILLAPAPNASDDDVIQTMKRLGELIGPHGGEGTPLGDCLPMQLRAFDGWLVSYALPLYTFVGADEVEEALKLPGSSTEVMQHDAVDGTQDTTRELRIALFGRHKRNKDASDPKIIARSIEALHGTNSGS